jgi:hypothetical protein
MLNPPLVEGTYPVTPLMEAFGFQSIVSVLSVPVAVAVVVTQVGAAPTEEVLRAVAPFAIVCVKLALEFWKQSTSQIEPAASTFNRHTVFLGIA